MPARVCQPNQKSAQEIVRFFFFGIVVEYHTRFAFLLRRLWVYGVGVRLPL